MRPPRSRPISAHRLARFTAWLVALLAWFAFGVAIKHRHHKRHVSIATLRQAVRNIILIRAAELIAPPRVHRRMRDTAPSGFRCVRRRASLRAITGIWLRRNLTARGDIRVQARRLLDALVNWRALAAQLAHRRRRGLTRLVSLKLAHPAAAPLASIAAPAPCAADTS